MTREEKIQIAAALTAGVCASGKPMEVTVLHQFIDFLGGLSDYEEEIESVLKPGSS